VDACVDWSQTDEVRRPITLDAVGFVVGEDGTTTPVEVVLNPDTGDDAPWPAPASPSPAPARSGASAW
jgi:hypothetical protein